MENIDKGLTVPKWVLINLLKIPQMSHNFLAQFVCPSPKVWDFMGVRSPCVKQTDLETNPGLSSGFQTTTVRALL